MGMSSTPLAYCFQINSWSRVDGIQYVIALAWRDQAFESDEADEAAFTCVKFQREVHSIGQFDEEADMYHALTIARLDQLFPLQTRQPTKGR